MKSFVSHASRSRAFAAFSFAFRVATPLVLAALVVGCTSRKQYQINEAILIGERRQLEDEIYQARFELRDALEENERLHQELERLNSGEEPEKKEKRSVRARKPSRDDELFPGGDELNVDHTAPSYQRERSYDESKTAPALNENVETLPDFVPIPQSRSGAKRYSQSPDASRRFGTSRPVASNAEEQEFGDDETIETNAVRQVVYMEPIDGAKDELDFTNDVDDASNANDDDFDDASGDDWAPVESY